MSEDKVYQAAPVPPKLPEDAVYMRQGAAEREILEALSKDEVGASLDKARARTAEAIEILREYTKGT